MKTKTKPTHQQDTAAPKADDDIQSLLTEIGAREFAFSLRLKGKIVRGESYAWDWAEADKPDLREMRDFIMERLISNGVFPENRRSWQHAKLTLVPGPLLTPERLFVLRSRQWNVEQAA